MSGTKAILTGSALLGLVRSAVSILPWLSVGLAHLWPLLLLQFAFSVLVGSIAMTIAANAFTAVGPRVVGATLVALLLGTMMLLLTQMRNGIGFTTHLEGSLLAMGHWLWSSLLIAGVTFGYLCRRSAPPAPQ